MFFVCEVDRPYRRVDLAGCQACQQIVQLSESEVIEKKLSEFKESCSPPNSKLIPNPNTQCMPAFKVDFFDGKCRQICFLYLECLGKDSSLLHSGPVMFFRGVLLPFLVFQTWEIFVAPKVDPKFEHFKNEIYEPDSHRETTTTSRFM